MYLFTAAWASLFQSDFVFNFSFLARNNFLSSDKRFLRFFSSVRLISFEANFIAQDVEQTFWVDR
jgi:hypothetical protein